VRRRRTARVGGRFGADRADAADDDDGDDERDGDGCVAGRRVQGQDDMDAIGDCDMEAPPDSFEPEVQWAWAGRGRGSTVATPLVANLTDDNGDGAIDLCDIPGRGRGRVRQAGPPAVGRHIYVLDGATGALHFKIPERSTAT
jgi:hypothetical protein